MGAELVADLLGVGVTEVVEDLQGQVPGRAGGAEVAGGFVDFAEVAQAECFVVAVTRRPEQGERLLVAGRGGMVVA